MYKGVPGDMNNLIRLQCCAMKKEVAKQPDPRRELHPVACLAACFIQLFFSFFFPLSTFLSYSPRVLINFLILRLDRTNTMRKDVQELRRAQELVRNRLDQPLTCRFYNVCSCG